MITSLLLAIKFVDDHFYTNEYYSKIAWISNEELNILEIEFIKMLDFRLFEAIAHYPRYIEEIALNSALT